MSRFIVRGLSRACTQGKLHLGFQAYPCALGRSGRGPKAKEGDGVTPIGCWEIRHVYYRPDRLARPRTSLSVAPITANMGWCDAPDDANYNRPVPLPYPASHEALWRGDHLYDLLAVLGANDWPRAKGRGSAIFLHLARSDCGPTEGCIALSRPHLERVLRVAVPGDRITIE